MVNIDNIVYVRSEGNDVMNGVDIRMVDYRRSQENV